MMIPNCSIPDCDGQVKARGWCWLHLQRWYRHRDPLHEPPRSIPKPKRTRPTVLQRIFSQVEITDHCWIWLGVTTPDGYGRAWSGPGGAVKFVHRMMYELCVGPIPDGLTIDHLCRVRPCIRTDHLEVVSLQTNILRSPVAPAAINARKTHCKHGHEFTPENIYRRPARPHTRSCRVCIVASGLRHYRKRRGDDQERRSEAHHQVHPGRAEG